MTGLLLDRILADAKELNGEVREGLDRITVAEARRIVRACREAEGWLQGVRVVLGLDGDDEREGES